MRLLIKRNRQPLLWLAAAAGLFLLARLLWHLSALWPDALGRIPRVLSSGVRWVTNLAPFSVMELFLLAAFCGLLAALILLLRRLFQRRWPAAGLIFAKLLTAGGALYLAFMLLMGMSYNGITAAEQMGLRVKPRPVSQLEEATAYLAEQCNRTVAQLAGEDYQRSFSDYGEEVRRSYQDLKAQWPFLRGVSARPKPVLCSVVMSYIGIDGICFPFTAEANVNRDLPSFALPNVMAHELAHSCGVAREDEASFIGFLACVGEGEGFQAYSGYSAAFSRCYSALARADREAASRVYQLLDERVRADYKTLSAFYAQFQGPVQEVSGKVNDAYLKAQGQTDGVESYGRVTDLILAWYETLPNA